MKYKAVLLIGPTGAGKTPLGDYLSEHGLNGNRCFHFDFGSCLRAVACGKLTSTFLSEDNRLVVERVLTSGTLLEDSEFEIALNILRSFIEKNDIQPDDFIILNGMPRHEGQAVGIDSLIDVQIVVYLQCNADIVHERISANSGGDRSSRVDDSKEEVENKLAIFKKRTAPLLDYYRNKGVLLQEVSIDIRTSAESIVKQIKG